MDFWQKTDPYTEGFLFHKTKRRPLESQAEAAAWSKLHLAPHYFGLPTGPAPRRQLFTDDN